MSGDKVREFGGKKYHMGVSIDDLKEGDVVVVSSEHNGRLERVTSIERVGKWDRIIKTGSGRSYSMTQIYLYGKETQND